MATLLCLNLRKVLMLNLVVFLFISLLFCVSSNSGDELESTSSRARRRMFGIMEEKDGSIKKNITKNNQTKLLKSNLSTKNQTKPTSSLSSKNQTKIAKSTNSTKTSLTSSSSLSKLDKNSTSILKKLNNSTSLMKKKLNSTSKSYNSPKNSSSSSTKNNSDLLKLGSLNNKTTKSTPTIKKPSDSKKQEKVPNQSQSQEKVSQSQSKKQEKIPSWIEQDGSEDDDDLVSEFRDLPSKFQQTIYPDFEKISIASKKYITKANKEMTKGFKPIMGHKYASISATVVSFAFILIPLLLVSLVVNRIKAYFSIQKIVIFIQVYLSIYFSILCVSSIVTGLEPLKFFYATSQSTYVSLMVLQTLGYVFYLLLLVMYLILVFSTESGLGSKFLGLAQIFVGLAVGLHLYVAVFHRVVLHQPPKTNWKIHGIYATCFLAICMFAKFDRRKKAYLEDGGEEGKKN
ncbi:hypothetical protein M5689_013319 [Euphorbia peplus]|nr:hypothetical protein M5689_013319 [Euphorbia peplus]